MTAVPQRPLPDFATPPLSEVVLSVGFLDLPTLHPGILGLFWAQHLRDVFPLVEVQPPYDMPIEPLALAPPEEPSVQMLTGYPPPRFWFRNALGTQLVQVQWNWFAFNWQNAGGTAEYPRYQIVEEHFITYLRLLSAYLEGQRIGDIGATQCEVTYINQIPLTTAAPTIPDVVLFAGSTQGEFLGRPERTQFSASYLMSYEDEPCGRLHISAQPTFRRADSSPIVTLNLTARGYPLGDGEEGILKFLRLGREWVVRGFADVTAREMHGAWGRRA